MDPFQHLFLPNECLLFWTKQDCLWFVYSVLNNLDFKTSWIGNQTPEKSYSFFIEEKDSTETRWEIINNCYVGDKIVVTDSNTAELTAVAISNLEVVYESKTIYTLDFAPSDLFLVDVGESDFAVMHNGCWCSWSYCGNWCYATWCPTCYNETFK